MCCFTPPYLDYEFEGEMLDGTYSYSADSIISCFAFVRLLLVFKLYPHINKWTRRDVHELSIQDQYKAMSNEFTAKFELRYSPLIILAVLVIILVAYVGYTFRVLERSYSSTSKSSLNLEEIYNCQWLSFTSLSTVGYGDAYPSTHLGRLLAAFTGIFGIFFTALVIGVAISFSELTEKQLKAFYIQKRSDRMVPVKESAADVIKTAFRLKRDRLRRPKLAAFITHHYDSIYTPKLKKFNNIYRFFRHSFIPAAMALDMMQSKMKLNSIQLREGFENFEKTTDYKEKLEKLTQHRDRQQEKLREIKQDLDTIEVEFLTIVNYIGAGESLT